MSNTNKEYTESDWKLFRKKIVEWQENYMDNLNQEYIKLLSQDENPSDKFWKLSKRINKDKRSPGVVIDLRRSTMVVNILDLLNNKIIEIGDLDDFSDILKDTINSYLRVIYRID